MVSGPKNVEFVVTPVGIDLIFDSPIASYTSMALAKPDRFVIDLPGARVSTSTDKVPLNNFGVASVLLAELEGKSRIVFHGRTGVFRGAKVIRTSKGLSLQLLVPGLTQKKSSNDSPAVDGDLSHSSVESLDFEVVETGSRITMKVSGSCSASQSTRNAEGLSLSVKKCHLPRNLRRPVDTSAFASAVQSLNPQQLTVKGETETRVLIKVKQAVTWAMHQESGTIILDIFHPKLTESQVLPRSLAPPVVLVSETTLHKLQESVTADLGAKKIYSGRKITLEFVDADIRKIFQLIADVSNLNILLGDDVTGSITIKLVNVPWDQALDTILESKGLGMRAEGNIVLIKPQSKFKSSDDEILDAKKSREKMMDLKTRVFDVNFAQSTDVVNQFKTLASGRTDSSITQDERTNKVIVTDIEPAVNRMKQFLESIDIPEKQVLIEARIIEASDSFTRDLGIQWGLHYRDASASIMGINSFSTGFGGYSGPRFQDNSLRW
jgi:type IV pilus assembly protein PilQ